MNAPFIGYVYETKNSVNGKFYIGLKWRRITKTGVIDPSYLGSGKALWRAIRKYGRDAFTVRALSWHTSREHLSAAERKAIKDYRRRYGAENVYNLTDGGIGGTSLEGCRKGGLAARGRPWSAESRKRVMGRRMSEEAKSKMSFAALGNTKGRANKGRVMSVEWRAKLAESHRGLKHSPEHIARFRESIARTLASKSPEEKRLVAERLMRPRMIKYLLEDGKRAFHLIDNPVGLEIFV